MSVRTMDDGSVALEGDCPLDDAEELLRRLLEGPAARVDWTACETMHTAVLQVLLAADAQMVGNPRGEVLARWVAPLLRRGPA